MKTLLALMVAIAATPVVAAELPKHDYAQAIAAVDRGEWMTAAAHLAAVMRVAPRAHDMVRLYGMHFAPYVPSHYAAVVAAKLGDCHTALLALDDPDTARIVSLVPARAAERSAIASRCALANQPIAQPTAH
jgi:hypothetical protein